MPLERDALVGSWQLRDLATIYTQLGEYDEARETLERYLSRPRWVHIGALGLDPRLRRLKDHPGFMALVSRFGSDERGRGR